MRVVSKYEVGCPVCEVSYPPEQKRCVHCGGRTAPRIVEVGDSPPEFQDGVTPAPAEPEAHEQQPGGGELVFFPSAQEASEEAPRASKLRRLSTYMWIIIAVGITAVRACTGE